MFSQLRLGALHFFLISSGNLATVVPPIDIENLGFVYGDADEGARVMEGRLGTYLRQEAAAKGVYALRAVWNSGMSQVISNTHPIRNPDDLHGFKLRTAESKILIDLFRRLGASPSPLNLAETYTALQTKLIDGEALSVGTIYATRHFEVGKYISMTNHGWSGPWMIANAETWKGLPPNLREIVERNNTKYSLLERRDMQLNTAAVTDKLRRQGIAFNPVDPAQFRARLGSYYEAWRGEFGATSWDLLQSSLGRKLMIAG